MSIGLHAAFLGWRGRTFRKVYRQGPGWCGCRRRRRRRGEGFPLSYLLTFTWCGEGFTRGRGNCLGRPGRGRLQVGGSFCFRRAPAARHTGPDLFMRRASDNLVPTCAAPPGESRRRAGWRDGAGWSLLVGWCCLGGWMAGWVSRLVGYLGWLPGLMGGWLGSWGWLKLGG